MSHRRVLAHLLIFVLSLLLTAPSAVYGQTLYGALVGNVKDASDAVIAGATVTVTNVRTNQTRETKSNETGSYSLSTLEPGTYTHSCDQGRVQCAYRKRRFGHHQQCDPLRSHVEDRFRDGDHQRLQSGDGVTDRPLRCACGDRFHYAGEHSRCHRPQLPAAVSHAPWISAAIERSLRSHESAARAYVQRERRQL
ncbi:MAG: carboxypeptidase regulatory-like domain-containing protein [Candidatus Solibacter usitatus]|nr:carboxypeptidase regulatory-like domain-containing protein [Candidatus Solibacter usitatus]